MIEELKHRVCECNLALVKHGLVIKTFGNASAIDRDRGRVIIKPSGVHYHRMKSDQMVVVDLDDGKALDGNLKPSSDLKTHLEIYRNFHSVGGVVHVHSTYAVSWAQAGMSIPCYGTTHADYFNGAIPITQALSKEAINGDYELETGRSIIETFKTQKLNAESYPGVLVNQHGPFTWGKDCEKAVEHAVIVETVAKMAALTLSINPEVQRVSDQLLEKHYTRKHGKNAYYGQ